jgi:high-affinity nickel permease
MVRLVYIPIGRQARPPQPETNTKNVTVQLKEPLRTISTDLTMLYFLRLPMIGFLSILAVGFFLGMRHATDPDHVIAVTTIVSNQRNSMRAALIGAFWGIGHTLTIFVVGAGIILFNLVIPVRVGLSMELSVAVMLIILGLLNVAGFLQSVPARSIHTHDGEVVVHSHPHSHGDYTHSHPHVHQTGPHSHLTADVPVAWMDRVFGTVSLYQYVRPFGVGIVHGLAGSAAVALLVLTTIRNVRWAIAYLLIFGVGTIAGMMLITMSLASAFRLVGTRQKFSRRLALASGLLSVGFGLFIAYQICFVDGLFGSHARWIPQ